MGAPGCDDAPLITVPRGSVTKPFTLIVPYYENPRFLMRQVDGWLALPRLIRAFLQVIVVDDGSPVAPAEAVLVNMPVNSLVKLFRIEVDVRWNWLAARNIGARHAAADGWLLLTDIDHVVEPQIILDLINGAHDPNVIYRFSRIEHTGEKIHPHPNSWFMTKQMYWKIGGYDEALSGYYGTDGDYRRRCAATAPIRIMTSHLVRHEYVEDSSTTYYKRKQPEDARGKQLMKARKHGWKPKVLSFPYHEVKL